MIVLSGKRTHIRRRKIEFCNALRRLQDNSGKRKKNGSIKLWFVDEKPFIFLNQCNELNIYLCADGESANNENEEDLADYTPVSMVKYKSLFEETYPNLSLIHI